MAVVNGAMLSTGADAQQNSSMKSETLSEETVPALSRLAFLTQVGMWMWNDGDQRVANRPRFEFLASRPSAPLAHAPRTCSVTYWGS